MEKAASPDMPVELPHVAVEGKLAQRFFSSVFSKANCPQKRSNSAIRASADGTSEEPTGRKASSPH